MNAVSDEVECSTTLHLERSPRVMREHEHRRVIRRLISPPAFPTLVRPWSAHRTKHIPSENIGADILETARGDIVVDAILAVFATVHTLPGASREEPVKHLKPANAERILEILIRPGAVPINGDGETVNAKFRHKKSLLSAVPEGVSSGTIGSRETEFGYVVFFQHFTPYQTTP